ncbi:MAG: hypothetical protein AB8G22_23400, partial [Saprospiraceae bacterium]
QVQIVNKLRTLEVKISKANFNNILKVNKVGLATLLATKAGMEEILAVECSLKFDEQVGDFVDLPTTEIKKLTKILEQPSNEEDPWFNIIPHWKGRPDIAYKANFIKTAQKEVVEVGVRLNAFTGYFLHRSDYEFKIYIEQLFERKVNLKMYLLDPDSNAARHYFSDRAEEFAEEEFSTDVIKEVLRKLKRIKADFATQGKGDHFQVFTYKHLPHNHFLIVDGAMQQGKMMVSHYLYGVKRANAPVIEFTKAANRDLFRQYRTSYLALVKKAKQVI